MTRRRSTSPTRAARRRSSRSTCPSPAGPAESGTASTTEFGAKAAAVPAPKGKFSATEQGSVELSSEVGDDYVTTTASVKAVFQGKVVGKQSSGTYTITSTDGSGCSGHGTWKAKLAEPAGVAGRTQLEATSSWRNSCSWETACRRSCPLGSIV